MTACLQRLRHSLVRIWRGHARATTTYSGDINVVNRSQFMFLFLEKLLYLRLINEVGGCKLCSTSHTEDSKETESTDISIFLTEQ